MKQNVFSVIVSALVFFVCADVVSAEQFSIQFKIPRGPQGDLVLLPTPLRVMAEANFEVGIRTGFGPANQTTTFRPTVNVMEGQEDTQELFQTLYDVPTQETDAQRTTRLTQLLSRRTRTVLENNLQVNVNLRRDREYFVELGGNRAFQSVSQTHLRKFNPPEKGNRIEFTVPVIQFPASDKESIVRYKLFKFVPSLLAPANTVPSSRIQNPSAYFSEVVYREEGNTMRAGSTDATQAPRRAFVLSTCVEFRDLGAPNKTPQMDFSSQCWIYDLKQISEVLPVTGEDHSRGGVYLVVRQAFDLESKAKASVYTMADTFRNSFVKLPEVSSWTKID